MEPSPGAVSFNVRRIAVPVVGLVGYYSRLLESTTGQEIGEKLSFYREERIAHSAEIIHGAVKALQTLALSLEIIQTIEKANRFSAIDYRTTKGK